MKGHREKKIAPIVITVILLVYYGFYFALLIKLLPPFVSILFGVIPAVMAVMIIVVCIQRIREINGGEEDDLSQY